jgi:hypothetical protein
VVHHVLEHVQSGIAVIALRKHAEAGHQRRVQSALLGIGQAQLGVEKLYLGP